MKVTLINGSPRKEWNTGILLKNALEGAASQGAETELIHLYDYNYKGCRGCFACRLKGGKSYGRCAVNDDLKPILDKVEETDALIIGSPVFFAMVSGETRSLLERLMFQYLVYDGEYTSLAKKKIPTGLIYNMNIPEDSLEQLGYPQIFKTTIENPMKRMFGSCESLFVTDTYQFDDYSKYEASGFNAEEKTRRRREVFPEDCKKAFDMGKRFARQDGCI